MPQDRRDIAGTIQFSDGDSATVNGKSIRIHGVDAVEFDQTCVRPNGTTWACGKWVTQKTRDRWAGRHAQCDVVTIDQCDRFVAKCWLDGQDIGAEVVRAGLATAFQRYSTDYVDLELAAKSRGAGLWSSEFVQPATYRQTKSESGPNGCQIKGNISAKGKIYHRPEQRFYAGTRISKAKGERWFCSPQEAEAAGWRAAQS